ncbi:2-octaprenyl-6-methoxyphenyl hydroxylase [Fulvimonas soli]|jgi:2-octaprenyl-6-methoxyphenol hydroxylase|uniref:2-octaprenyl-6-methoxyphenol hydroxylase /2-octaprenyl-3-methyl-6-methoxy-1,4-benzoquinol hydroxylase n=1 Tax=Fulvimonas soli TaxID=155197 RepID=A0A316I544_9GAMM|nr:2-octaprenyl-6-methoxyphenyl hydroxylase [Fulvimonas soli]PWK88582.1 2-octaprenyl-6-methoxyphenol hydroxylase /2-octaprenyl-3-methyl-6-methoxy-1,4-benzoquinol hydroxylase [Fulvimonas soli]TNY27288.1 2-octaprenyl-6-methoxyphenyl hydroxylase [Fulvimonas soli]
MTAPDSPLAAGAASDAGVLVVGGGLVGASLAIALDAAGVAATLVEAAAPRADAQPSHDERNLALARATVNGLAAIGVWPHAAAKATPIRRIHVSRAGEFGSARLDARAEGVDALGWTLPARELGAALLRRLDACKRLQRLAPAQLEAIEPLPGGWRARVRTAGGARELRTPLLVGADGTDSFVRARLGIGADVHDYAQSLFVCTVTPERAHEGRAYERFADGGPVALLPLAEGRCGLVLTVPADEAGAVAALDDAAFLALAQRRFGWRLGRLSRPGRRHAYPIRRVAARALVAPRAVLVGNAAQTVHPVGAQGFNLGLRDALTLAELVAAAADPGDAALLERYAARRAPDREGTMAMSHGLVRLACLEQPLLAPLRSLALLAFDRVPPLRRALARRGMGFRGAPPRAVLEKLP